jgi:hypothetical protein
MLSNDSVIEVLDRHGGLDLNKSIHMFREGPYQVVKQDTPESKSDNILSPINKRLSTQNAFDKMVASIIT